MAISFGIVNISSKKHNIFNRNLEGLGRLVDVATLPDHSYKKPHVNNLLILGNKKQALRLTIIPAIFTVSASG